MGLEATVVAGLFYAKIAACAAGFLLIACTARVVKDFVSSCLCVSHCLCDPVCRTCNKICCDDDDQV